MVRGYDQYMVNETNTASPDKLVLMAYDGMVRFLCAAEEALKKRDYEALNSHIQRVQSILSVLSANLRPEVFPSLCKRLSSLYDWFQLRLVTANINEDSSILIEVRNQIGELRDAWLEAERRCRSDQAVSHSPETVLEEAA